MKDTASRRPSPNPLVQLLVLFVFPIIVLTRFSGNTKQSAMLALLIALAFPVAYELAGFIRHRKLGIASALSIGGIVVTGAISLWGLSEEWLAIRRAVPYFMVSLGVFAVVRFKPALLYKALPAVLDMETINQVLQKKHQRADFDKTIVYVGYMVSTLFFIAAGASYILTKIIIDSPTNTAGFNQQYVALRLISLPAVTLPLVLGIIGILFYLVRSIEKLSGLDFEKILRKK